MSREHVNKATHQWLLAFHQAGDLLQPGLWMKNFFAEDAVLKFAGSNAVKGHENLINFFEPQFAALESMVHTVTNFDVLPHRIYQEAEIVYVVKADPDHLPIKVKGMAVFEKQIDEDRVRSFTVYLDPTPLRERIVQVMSKESK